MKKIMGVKWEDLSFISNNISEKIVKIKQQLGKNFILFSGATLATDRLIIRVNHKV